MLRLTGVCLAGVIIGSMADSRADDFERLQLGLNGHASVVAAYVDQTNLSGLDQGVLAVDTGLYGVAVLPLDGGGEIGGRLAFDLDYASNFDAVLNDAGSNDVLEELWLYWEGRLGRVQLGLMDGAADILGYGVPVVSKSILVDGPEIFLLGFPCNPNNCSSSPQAPGSLFSPNGMQLRSDIHASDDYLKLMYATPVFDGLRFAVSYAPDGTRDPGELFGGDDLNEQANIWDFAAEYAGTLGAVDVGLSAGYVTGEIVNRSLFFDELGDVREWGAAARLGYREWAFGVAYRNTNVAGGGPIVQGPFANVFHDEFTEIWSFGLTYECGPWMLGAGYIMSEEELVFTDAEQDGSGLHFAAGYTFNETVRLTGGYQRFEFQGPFNNCLNFGGGSCDTLDGDVGYLETTLSF